jgi:hypothetical protein
LSAALKADAVESALCGYMAWIALAGLEVNAISGKSWADAVAALALTPLILREAWEAFHASRLGCNCSYCSDFKLRLPNPRPAAHEAGGPLVQLNLA